MDIRDELIGRVVTGATFADVGGLWGTVSEKVSVAHAHGASHVSMIDISAKDSVWWTAFEARCKSLAVPDVECVSGDVVEITASAGHSQYDVVHSSGVLYHVPDQMRLLGALRKLARRNVVLTSVVTPTRIENEAGVFEIPECGAIFVPALSGSERAVVRAHWRQILGTGGAGGLMSEVARWDTGDFGPWWWIPTVATLVAMCKAAGFTVIDVQPSWSGYAATILLGIEGAESSSAAA